MADKLLEGFKRFRKEHYKGKDALMPRLKAIMEANKLVSHTDVFRFLLAAYEAASGPAVLPTGQE